MREIEPLCSSTDNAAIQEEQKLANFSLLLIVATIHHGATKVEFREEQGSLQIAEWVDGERSTWPDPPPGVLQAIHYHYHVLFPLFGNPSKVYVGVNRRKVCLEFNVRSDTHWSITFLRASALKGQCASLLDEFWRVMKT